MASIIYTWDFKLNSGLYYLKDRKIIIRYKLDLSRVCRVAINHLNQRPRLWSKSVKLFYSKHFTQYL